MWKLVAWFGNSNVAGIAAVAACVPMLFQSLVQSSDSSQPAVASIVTKTPMNVRHCAELLPPTTRMLPPASRNVCQFVGIVVSELSFDVMNTPDDGAAP